MNSDKMIAVGADHAGFELKQQLVAVLEAAGWSVIDLGTNSPDSVDYPDFGFAVARAVAGGRAPRGLVVCGSGIGINMAANRVAGARAALCTSGLMARLARQHNDANILALGSRIVGIETARDCLREFLGGEFEGGRHQRRVDKLSSLAAEKQAWK